MGRKAQALRASRLLKEAYPYERWGRKDHAGNPGIVRGVPVALQKVLGHDTPLHPCHRCQGKPTAGHCVPRCIDGWIGHALQILVDGDAVLLACDSGSLQVEVVDLRHAPGGMHHQVSLDHRLLLACPRLDQQVVTLPLDRRDRRVELHFDAEFAGGLDQLGDQIRVKLLEGAAASVEYLDLCASPCCDVRELEGDVAATNEDDAARELVQLQKLRAGGQVLLPWYPQGSVLSSG